MATTRSCRLRHRARPGLSRASALNDRRGRGRRRGRRRDDGQAGGRRQRLRRLDDVLPVAGGGRHSTTRRTRSGRRADALGLDRPGAGRAGHGRALRGRHAGRLEAAWATTRPTSGCPRATTGLGLLLLGNAASGYFGTADFATNDFDPAFDTWLDAITANDGSERPAGRAAASPSLRRECSTRSARPSVRYDDEVPDSRAEDQLPVVEPNPQPRWRRSSCRCPDGQRERRPSLADVWTTSASSSS